MKDMRMKVITKVVSEGESQRGMKVTERVKVREGEG